MIKPYFSVVIGKGFGDEGKGMAVDYLASRYKKTLVVRHNGGAQSGHTVELPDKRFVFHELSSGSFRGADTFWADTFYPDMFKLGEEIKEFRIVTGGKSDFSKSDGDKERLNIPAIYVDMNTQVTTIDDVLINMAAETMRGEGRHGSCGMGIYEAFCRGEAGYGITIGELIKLDVEGLVSRLEDIRREYLPKRLRELGIEVVGECGYKVEGKEVCGHEEFIEYMDMLKDRNVLENVASVMLENMSYVKPVWNVKELFDSYDSVIFENGQGLLLDTDNEEYSPHVTASKTGLYNPCRILGGMGYIPDEVVYVTRSYVTRHGAGPLPNECDREKLGIMEVDVTNIHNPWQGSIRYGRHSKIEDFYKDIKVDMENLKGIKSWESTELNMKTSAGSAHNMDEHKTKCILMITHLDETKGKLLCEDGDVDVEKLCRRLGVKRVGRDEGGDYEGEGVFDGYYLSWSRYGVEKIVDKIDFIML